LPGSAAELSQAIRERLGAAPVARLATVGAGGAPHIVPIVFALAGDDLVTAVDHKPKRTVQLARLHNIAINPQVCVLVDHYEDDWSALWWIRVDGIASLHEPGTSEHRLGHAALQRAYPRHYAGVELGTMIRIAPTAVRSWDGAR
jgi:PPOX class probable F420-dependent enzyme